MGKIFIQPFILFKTHAECGVKSYNRANLVQLARTHFVCLKVVSLNWS
jgi:hypothetical protein